MHIDTLEYSIADYYSLLIVLFPTDLIVNCVVPY